MDQVMMDVIILHQASQLGYKGTLYLQRNNIFSIII